MLALAVTIHNLPEGMAVGVVFAGAENGSTHISLAAAISVSLGIAIQNIPEGGHHLYAYACSWQQPLEILYAWLT